MEHFLVQTYGKLISQEQEGLLQNIGNIGVYNKICPVGSNQLNNIRIMPRLKIRKGICYRYFLG